MKRDMILILDLGSEEGPRLAREIRAMGVDAEVRPHDITAEQLAACGSVKGIILNGGPSRMVNGAMMDASREIYNAGLPILLTGHDKGRALPKDPRDRETVLRGFVFDTCGAVAG